jgi:hypothetical protein
MRPSGILAGMPYQPPYIPPGPEPKNRLWPWIIILVVIVFVIALSKSAQILNRV